MAGPASARLLLATPTIEAAVLEVARGGILRDGLGYDYNDVAIVTNVTGDHLGPGRDHHDRAAGERQGGDRGRRASDRDGGPQRRRSARARAWRTAMSRSGRVDHAPASGINRRPGCRSSTSGPGDSAAAWRPTPTASSWWSAEGTDALVRVPPRRNPDHAGTGRHGCTSPTRWRPRREPSPSGVAARPSPRGSGRSRPRPGRVERRRDRRPGDHPRLRPQHRRAPIARGPHRTHRRRPPGHRRGEHARRPAG